MTQQSLNLPSFVAIRALFAHESRKQTSPLANMLGTKRRLVVCSGCSSRRLDFVAADFGTHGLALNKLVIVM